MQASEWLIFDPILRGPLFACTLMGALGGLVGVLVVLRRQSLVGETLSHACYPGMILGAILAESVLEVSSPTITMLITFGGAAVSSLITAKLVTILIERKYASSDAALSCLLSATFAAGLFCISAIESIQPHLWRRLQSLLMGQAATMRDWYVLVAFLLSTGSIVLVIIFRRSVKASLFDTDFARLAHLTNSWIEWLLLGMLVATVIVSIRLMGVVLMSAVLIFPAVSARLLTSSFEKVLLIATILGGVCGFGGVMLSHKCALAFQALSGHSLWLPTGPLIALLLTGTFCVVLLFSPSEGLAIRAWRRFLFVRRCQRENILKMMWKECSRTDTWRLRKGQLRELFSIPPRAMKKVVRGLKRTGYLHLLPEGGVEMTPQGILMGRKLVRLHRLWELYLVEFCGMPRERVHPNAEEMEHILTPEIESELSALLHNPSFDPHAQPIPTAEKEFLSNGYRT